MNDPYRPDPRRSWWRLARARTGTESDRRNFLVLAAWLVAWAASYLAATWVLQRDMELSITVNWLLVVVPTAFAIKALFAYLRFLRLANEVLRRTQADALAIGGGAGIILGVAYPLFEQVGAPSMQVSHIITVMTGGWAAGLLLGIRRNW